MNVAQQYVLAVELWAGLSAAEAQLVESDDKIIANHIRKAREQAEKLKDTLRAA